MLATIDNKYVYIVGGVTGLSVMVLLLAYVAFQKKQTLKCQQNCFCVQS
jgi:hypothetical protein